MTSNAVTVCQASLEDEMLLAHGSVLFDMALQ